MKPDPIGLVCAGGVLKSWLAKRRSFLEALGPVKAASLRVATRMANALRAGKPVDTYDAFASCSIIFVLVPPRSLSRVLNELAAAKEIRWPDKTIVVVDGFLDTVDLRAFELKQASAATVDLIDANPPLRLAVQGSPRAVKTLRNLLEAEGARLFELEPGAKPAYQAGWTLASSAITPVLAAAIECFASAGLDAAQAQVLADLAMARARRSYLKAGRKGWSGTLANRDRDALLRQWEQIRRRDPALARYFLATATASVEFFTGDASWTEPHPETQSRPQFDHPATAD